jgi:F-type H+-transporting ATPase subunit delta
VSPTTHTFVRLLVERDRLSAPAEISRSSTSCSTTGRPGRRGGVGGPAVKTQVKELTARLEKLSGRKVQLTTREDPELLAGVVAKVGDVVYDGSLRRQLERLREEIS